MAAETILVGCKSPRDIELNLDSNMVEGDGRRVRFVPGKLPPVVLKGNGRRRLIGEPEPDPIGYVFTPVPKAFMDEWMARNKDDYQGVGALIRDGVIIVSPNRQQAQGENRERIADPGLFEPLKPQGDDRMKADLSKVKPYEQDD